MDGIGIHVAMAWPMIVVQVNAGWLVVVFLLMVVWHALTGGRRSRGI